MAAASRTHAESIGELSHLIDRAVADVAHGRFERSLSGLTAVAAAVTTAEIFSSTTRPVSGTGGCGARSSSPLR